MRNRKKNRKKTTASGKPVMVQSVRRTRSRRMKFCVQGGLGALPQASKAEGKITAGFFPLRAECINTGIACQIYPEFGTSTTSNLISTLFLLSRLSEKQRMQATFVILSQTNFSKLVQENICEA
ncbi:hypothetical protein BLA28_21945 [Eisenbergiella tayi]|uniref:Uncharacterized protein n=1 Tax=Eisenbergiella tayi TaxID=1432052 RepID=A0A1E3UD80_9FIRM|nr:hypothetical protein BEI62_03315 [Eisenbergiella tayi]ODR47935.1 hypothetical protein BEI59_21435 [Eisenbergiella tayi]OIZ61813.1 hypothetical protein BLA28_21945 [Eisenbergiella tayi]